MYRRRLRGGLVYRGYRQRILSLGKMMMISSGITHYPVGLTEDDRVHHVNSHLRHCHIFCIPVVQGRTSVCLLLSVSGFPMCRLVRNYPRYPRPCRYRMLSLGFLCVRNGPVVSGVHSPSRFASAPSVMDPVMYIGVGFGAFVV